MSMPKPSVLCALSHGLYEPWLDIVKSGQDQTWLASQNSADVEILHFHASPVGRFPQNLDRLHERIRWSGIKRAAILRKFDRLASWPFLTYIPKVTKSQLLFLESPGDVIHIHFPDTYVTYRWKELALFKYFLEQTTCNFLFLTSTASYVRINALQEFISGLPQKNVYAGAHPYPEATFVSGACRILSRDVVQLILANRRKFDPAVIEDMALGDLVQSLGVNPIYTTLNNIDSIEVLTSITDKEIASKFHFRLKSGTLSERNDVQIMKALHQRVLNLGENTHA
jgi:hypothetical protein